MKLHHSITDLLEKTYELVSADYRDNFDEAPEKLQEAIHEQDVFVLEDSVDDFWYMDAEDSGIQYAIENLKDEMERAFDVDEERVDAFLEEYGDLIREEIRERDRSTYFQDCLRHTQDPICFYDTGYEMPEGAWNFNDKEMASYLGEVKRALHLKLKDTTWDQKLIMMISQASYGGQLVVYFHGDVEQLAHLEEHGYNQIIFQNAHVAIIDTVNGSGDDTYLAGSKIILPLNVKNIFVDKCMHYSYSYDVCGMIYSWCENTVVTFKKRWLAKKIPQSPINAVLEQQAQYQKTFKEGGCTPFDMDMRRHRNTYYINDFPCGTKCPHCGTFWID